MAAFPFLQIVVVLVVAGLIYWILTLIPLPPPFPRIIQVVVIVGVVLWLLSVFVPMLGGGASFGHLSGPCR